MMIAKHAALGFFVLVMSVCAGAFLYQSWSAPLIQGVLLSLVALCFMVMVALVIREAGREEMKRTERLRRIREATLCIGCHSPVRRPYVQTNSGPLGLACCERRAKPREERTYFPRHELERARKAGLIGG